MADSPIKSAGVMREAAVRDAASLRAPRGAHEKFPSWPSPAALQVPRPPPGGGSHRSKSWTDHTAYPKERGLTYTRPYMKRANAAFTQQLKTVLERCEKLGNSSSSGGGGEGYGVRPPTPPERDKPSTLTQAELEQYSQHSEGYHSYVSSSDSTTTTPFLDRLRRDSEMVPWEEPERDSQPGRDSVVTTSSGSASSNETLKWHGSLSDVSVASSSCPPRQLIAHSSRVQTPQRHHSESVLYLESKPSRNNKLRLFPVNTYSVQPAEPQQPVHRPAPLSPPSQPSLSVAERINELERQQTRYTYLDPEKRHRVSDPTLKAIQKKALLSFYERHHSGPTCNKAQSWRSEPQLSQPSAPAPQSPPPPQPPPRPRLSQSSRRASSASDYAGGSWREMAAKREKVSPPEPSSLKDGARHQHSSSCGSLSTDLLGPLIVGPSISVDDWVPERPPKKPHLRAAFAPAMPDRLPSPDLPPPSPPTVFEDEVFACDDPLPPPPPDLHPSDWPQSRPRESKAEPQTPVENNIKLLDNSSTLQRHYDNLPQVNTETNISSIKHQESVSTSHIAKSSSSYHPKDNSGRNLQSLPNKHSEQRHVGQQLSDPLELNKENVDSNQRCHENNCDLRLSEKVVPHQQSIEQEDTRPQEANKCSVNQRYPDLISSFHKTIESDNANLKQPHSLSCNHSPEYSDITKQSSSRSSPLRSNEAFEVNKYSEPEKQLTRIHAKSPSSPENICFVYKNTSPTHKLHRYPSTDSRKTENCAVHNHSVNISSPSRQENSHTTGSNVKIFDGIRNTIHVNSLNYYQPESNNENYFLDRSMSEKNVCVQRQCEIYKSMQKQIDCDTSSDKHNHGNNIFQRHFDGSATLPRKSQRSSPTSPSHYSGDSLQFHKENCKSSQGCFESRYLENSSHPVRHLESNHSFKIPDSSIHSRYPESSNGFQRAYESNKYSDANLIKRYSMRSSSSYQPFQPCTTSSLSIFRNSGSTYSRSIAPKPFESKHSFENSHQSKLSTQKLVVNGKLAAPLQSGPFVMEAERPSVAARARLQRLPLSLARANSVCHSQPVTSASPKSPPDIRIKPPTPNEEEAKDISQPKLSPTNSQRSTSKASYLASRRERERGVPNFEGSYKRTMSPSSGRHLYDYNDCDRLSSSSSVSVPSEEEKEPLSGINGQDHQCDVRTKDVIVQRMVPNNTEIENGHVIPEKFTSVKQEKIVEIKNVHLPNHKECLQQSSEVVSNGDHQGHVVQKMINTERDGDHVTQRVITMENQNSRLVQRMVTTERQGDHEVQSIVTSETKSDNDLQQTPLCEAEDSANDKLPKSVEIETQCNLSDSSVQRVEIQCKVSSAPPTPEQSPPHSPVQRISPLVTESLQLVQRSEVVLRVNAATSDAASQTELEKETATPPVLVRQKLQEEIECEQLSLDLVSQLPPTDKLQGLLVPDPDHKKPTDYVSDLFRMDATLRPRSARTKPSSGSCSSNSSDTSSSPSSLENNSVSPAEELVKEQPVISKSPVSPLPANSAYFTTSESKAKFLTRYGNDMTQLNGFQDNKELVRKKEELMTRLGRKLEVLKGEHLVVSEECRVNEELGEVVAAQVSRLARPHEAAKYRLHVEEVGKITSLLLGLSGRLARAENALMGLPQDHSDRKILESKRDKLQEQLEEAKKLKENIDRRSISVSNILNKYFNTEEYADYDHFINMKAKLIMDSREIADKIKLGEEQLAALRETLFTPD